MLVPVQVLSYYVVVKPMDVSGSLQALDVTQSISQLAPQQSWHGTKNSRA